MALEFKLPDIGEGIAEGEVTTWLVKEGQEVAEDEPLVEVMTDKATVEITSPRAGRVLKILVEEGTTVPIGTKIVVIGDEGETVPEGTTAPEASLSEEEPAIAMKPVATDEEPAAPAAGTAAAAAPAAAPERPATIGPVPGAAAGPRPGGKALATPAVRRRARESGVDIDRVPGSGPAGRVLASDLEAFRRGGGAPPAPARTAPPSGGEQRFKLKGVRKLISERLSESVRHAVHVTHVDEVDTSALDALIGASESRAEEAGVRLTYLPFITKALIATLREFPMFNATLDEDAGEIVHRYDYHVGVAVATDRGLLVPVVRHADSLSVLELAREIREKAIATRDNAIGPEDLSGSTISITNFGAIGGLFATPIINYPEAAILGVGTSRQRPVVVDGQIVARPMMYLSITFDHRVTDGAEGARFMNTLKNYLENPALIFMEW